MSKKRDEEDAVIASSGNIFADLGRPDAEEALARVRLAQQIAEIIEERAAAIAAIDDTIVMETAGVAMALDKLRESLDKVEAHLYDREFEKASHAGYQDVAHNFVYVQRTLAGLQTAAQQKEALISSIAEVAHAAYEEVAPHVEKRMHSAVKKAKALRQSLKEGENSGRADYSIHGLIDELDQESA